MSRGKGRPTAYRPEYCQEVVECCREGHSLTGFAGKIGVSRETISEWARVHPDFSVAVKAAKAAAAYAHELDANRVRKEGGGPGTATMIIFGLKNMAPDDYSDRQQVEMTGKDGGAIESNNTIRIEFIDKPHGDSSSSE